MNAAPASVGEALRLADASLDYLSTTAVSDLDGPACGEALIGLSLLEAKAAAARVRLLRRFDALNAHDADGHGSATPWLMAQAGLTRKAARAQVRQMRRLSQRPHLEAALGRAVLTESQADEVAEWTRNLPADLRAATDEIIVTAAEAGAPLEDLAVIAATAIEHHRRQQPDPDEDEARFRDRFLRVGVTFGGAAVLRGDLTPECAAAVRAVTESLGKKRGPEDERSEPQRFHDALLEACELLLRARLNPDRAGADTQVIAHIPLSQLRDMPGAGEVEDAWLRARLGEDGYLTGKDAEAAACDAQVVPVVTAHPDMDVIDKIITLATTAAAAEPTGYGSVADGTASADGPTGSGSAAGGIASADGPLGSRSPADTAGPAAEPPGPPTRANRAGPAGPRDSSGPAHRVGPTGDGVDGCADGHCLADDIGSAGNGGLDGSVGPAGHGDQTDHVGHADRARRTGLAGPGGPAACRDQPTLPSPQAQQALRYAIARLAIDFVSGPAGIASALRRGLLDKPWNTPSQPLDIGWANSIPSAIRRAVITRDKHCTWPGGCDRPASACDVHHIRHQGDGGETSLANCALLCQFHHDVCVHRRGWKIIRHPDGTWTATSPDGRRRLSSNAPPTSRAA